MRPLIAAPPPPLPRPLADPVRRRVRGPPRGAAAGPVRRGRRPPRRARRPPPPAGAGLLLRTSKGVSHVASHRRDRRRDRRRPVVRRPDVVHARPGGSGPRRGPGGVRSRRARSSAWPASARSRPGDTRCSSGRPSLCRPWAARSRRSACSSWRWWATSPSPAYSGWALLIIGVLGTDRRLARVRLRDLPDGRPAALGRGVPGRQRRHLVDRRSSARRAMGGTGGQPVFVAAFGSFAIGWIVLGLQAIRLDRPAVQLGAA